MGGKAGLFDLTRCNEFWSSPLPYECTTGYVVYLEKHYSERHQPGERQPRHIIINQFISTAPEYVQKRALREIHRPGPPSPAFFLPQETHAMLPVV